MKNLTNSSFLFNHCSVYDQYANGTSLAPFKSCRLNNGDPGYSYVAYSQPYQSKPLGLDHLPHYNKSLDDQLAICLKSPYHFYANFSKPPS